MNIQPNFSNNYSIEIVPVPKGTWDALIAENQSLRSQLNTCQTSNTALLLTIDSLREENRLLREEIQTLKNNVAELMQDKERNKIDQLVAKLTVAVQDLNSQDHLERKIPELRHLRRKRNVGCHFILADDPAPEKDECKYILRKVLHKLPPNVVQEFETANSAPGLVVKLQAHLKKYKDIPLDDDEEEDNLIKQGLADFFSPILKAEDIL